MNKEEIISAIALTNKVINNPTMPDAVKQVATKKRADLQAELDAMGGEKKEVETEEVVKTTIEKEVVTPKKEKAKVERKPRTPKAPTPKKETETPESTAEKSMEGKKLSVANCRELLAKLKTRREGAKKRVATRKKQGKPAQLTTIEVLKKTSDALETKVQTEVNKQGKLQKTTIKRSTKEVVDIVATIVSGIPTKAERTEYINEVIADLKKLIDKVEPITEKMAKGGIFSKGPLEFKDSIKGSDGNYTYNLTFQPINNISKLYIDDDESGKSTRFVDINYSIVQSFAQEFQDLMDEHEDEFTTIDFSFRGEVKSAFHDDKKYGASCDYYGNYKIFIGDESFTFKSGSLMQSLAESFIELYNKVGDKGYDDQEYAKGGMMAKGGKITRNKNKNDWKSMFDFFVENNYQPIGKRDLINMAYASSNGIDSAIPQSMYGDVDNTAYYVYDYQTDKMGELVDLRTKLKFSNVKVDVTIVQDGELKYGNELPSELQNATFHQALNYVFTHADVDQFAIRPKK